jgi:hypothetical protein
VAELGGLSVIEVPARRAQAWRCWPRAWWLAALKSQAQPCQLQLASSDPIKIQVVPPSTGTGTGACWPAARRRSRRLAGLDGGGVGGVGGPVSVVDLGRGGACGAWGGVRVRGSGSMSGGWLRAWCGAAVLGDRGSCWCGC